MQVVSIEKQDKFTGMRTKKPSSRAIHWLMGRNLAKLRESHGLTQPELAARIGVSDPKYISHIENGIRGLSKAIMGKLCDEFDVEESYFVTPLDDVEKPDPNPLLRALMEEWAIADEVERTETLLFLKKLRHRKLEK